MDVSDPVSTWSVMDPNSNTIRVRSSSSIKTKQNSVNNELFLLISQVFSLVIPVVFNFNLYIYYDMK